jgi:hypothetical protein
LRVCQYNIHGTFQTIRALRPASLMSWSGAVHRVEAGLTAICCARRMRSMVGVRRDGGSRRVQERCVSSKDSSPG